MGFWRDINDEFLKGFKAPPRSPWNAVRVRKEASPVDKRRLEIQYTDISNRLAILHQDLTETYQDHCGVEPDARRSFAYMFAYETAAQCFFSADVPTWEDRYLFTPLRTLFQALVVTDPKFRTLAPDGFGDVLVDEYFALSETLRDLERFLENGQTITEVCSEHLFQFGVHILKELPRPVVETREPDLALALPLIEALPEAHHELAVCFRHFMGLDAEVLREQHLLMDFQDSLLERILAASGLQLEDLEKKDLDTPLNHKQVPASDVVKQFFGKSPLATFFLTPVPYGF